MRPYCRLRCRCADTAVLCAQGRAACQLQLVRCALLPRVRLYQPICMHTVCRLYSLQCPLLSTLRMCVPRSLQTRAAHLPMLIKAGRDDTVSMPSIGCMHGYTQIHAGSKAHPLRP